MRICKLSDQVFGFDTLEGCQAYFTHVLPWSKYYFSIIGEGSRIAKSSIHENESFVFVYQSMIIAIGKLDDYEVDNNGKVTALKLDGKTLKVLEETAKLEDLEEELNQAGYSNKICQSQGWNIIGEEYESVAINFLVKHQWKYYL